MHLPDKSLRLLVQEMTSRPQTLGEHEIRSPGSPPKTGSASSRPSGAHHAVTGCRSCTAERTRTSSHMLLLKRIPSADLLGFSCNRKQHHIMLAARHFSTHTTRTTRHAYRHVLSCLSAHARSASRPCRSARLNQCTDPSRPRRRSGCAAQPRRSESHPSAPRETSCAAGPRRSPARRPRVWP